MRVITSDGRLGQTGVVFDNPPIFKSFGDVLADVNAQTAYTAGQTVQAWFVGANPRVSVDLSFSLHLSRRVDGNYL